MDQTYLPSGSSSQAFKFTIESTVARKCNVEVNVSNECKLNTLSIGAATQNPTLSAYA
jgi:hypothetical protein